MVAPSWNIPSLRSSDLDGLLQESVEDGPPKIQVLLLNNTAVDDDAEPFISACTELENLAVGGTKFTSELEVSIRYYRQQC